MTVKELIAILETHNPESLVEVTVDSIICPKCDQYTHADNVSIDSVRKDSNDNVVIYVDES